MSTRIQLFHEDRLICDSDAPRVSIGRGDANDAALESFAVSRRHAEVDSSGGAGEIVVRDLGSANGSVVRRGAQRIPVDDSTGRTVLLEDGDELLLGPAEDAVVIAVRIVGMTPRYGTPALVPGSMPEVILEGGTATILGVNRIDDVAQIAQRVEDDPAALKSLYALLKGVSGSRATSELFESLVKLVLDAFPGATHATIYLRGAEGEDAGSASGFHPVVARGRAGPVDADPASRTLLGRLLEDREAILFEDLSSVGHAASLVDARVQSGLVVPLWDDEEVRGFVQVVSRIVTGAFTEKDLDLLTLMGNQAALILRNISMTENLRALNAELTAALERIEMLNRAKEHLAKFVPTSVRKTVESSPMDPVLEPRDVDASVLFLDIGGYTKLTESLDREQVSFLVERYFSAFIDDIYENDGDINETAGDGLMIIFLSDDPMQHCLNAVRASIAVRAKTAQVNAELGRTDNPIAVNMGINTGVVSVGSRKIAGLAGERWTYTATGMVTNLSARIGAFATDGRICIGPTTAERIGDGFPMKEHPPVQFKNVSKPMPVFELL